MFNKIVIVIILMMVSIAGIWIIIQPILHDQDKIISNMKDRQIAELQAKIKTLIEK